MSHLRSLAIGYAMATTLFAAAQAHSLGDRAQLLSLHYGSKATGTPPVVRWQPSSEVAARFETYSSGPLETTVDTTFQVGGSELIVFFRTQVPRDPESVFCEFCVDRIDMARMSYDDNDRPTKKEAFIPGFLEQGTLEDQRKPELVVMNNWPVAVKFVSSEGDMMNMSRSEHYFSFPELKPILSVTTFEFQELRGGPNGPMNTQVERTVRFIAEDEENTSLYEAEVTTMTDGGTRTSAFFVWSEDQHRFVPKAASANPAVPAVRKK
ncbi:MAG: hypothetical protein E6Q44_05495 [Flavobacteriales bacterium]|jgi:hypothetical protein|nr:MAG: hypothetical protein E6Q44_05495 [Flavobacteriales bacterium]